MQPLLGPRLVVNKLSTTAGFLEDCEVTFSPMLTCVIGARGTCKSTLIESLRFALNSDEQKLSRLIAGPRSSLPSEGREGMLSATLGPGTVRCQVNVVSANGLATFDIEREIGGAPRVYEAGVREFDAKPASFNIEVLSQNDLQLLADDASNELRLRLIDRPYQANIDKLNSEREKLGLKLVSDGNKLRALRLEVSSLRSDVQARGIVAQQLASLEADAPKPSVALEAELSAFEIRRSFQNAANATKERLLALQQDVVRLRVAQTHEDISAVIATGEEIPEFQDTVRELKAISELIKAFEDSSARLLQQDVSTLTDSLADQVEKLNEPYYRLRADEQHVNEVMKQTAQLRRQLDMLDKREAELRAKEQELRSTESERQTARQGMNVLESEVYGLRSAEIESINQEHFETVLLSLTVGHASAAYERAIFDLLQGSRIREQKEVASEIAAVLPPAALVDIVESVKAQELATMLNRDLGQTARILSHMNDHANLYSLEALSPATKLDITFYDGASAKPVESLSKGQKATALLPIVLRALPYPLVIDQPEDDLDNHFVFSFLVKAVQELRLKRQIIFVTHNANIPVLGDADQIVVMSMSSPTKAAIPLMGNVEHCKQDILDLLEGGAEAFALREVRYHDLLTH